MEPRYATVSATTRAIAHTGQGIDLEPGRYTVCEIDGATERGVYYLHGPDDGALVAVSRTDPKVTVE